MIDRTARRSRVLILLAVVLAVTVLLLRPQLTDASFTDAEHARGAVTADRLLGVTPNGCSISGFTVTIRWTLPTGGVPRSGLRYEVFREGTSVASGALATTATQVAYTRGLLTQGSYTFVVTTLGPAGTVWQTARTGSAEWNLFGGGTCSWD